MPIQLTQTEKRNGFLFLAANLFVFPTLLGFAKDLLSLNTAQINLFYNTVNFLFILRIFRNYLLGNLAVALDRVFLVIWYGILGYLGFQTLGELISMLISIAVPGFANLNDRSVAALVRESPLFALSVITLVPVTEEVLFRGLLFRGLYGKSPVLAYCTSVLIFAFIHVAGFIGTLSPLHLLVSLIQYLPAGYCLCFAYRHSGTVLCPILIHMAINAISVFAYMR